ncbi:MAG TPA: protein kinase [Candidatus Acidoferrales bacterium]|nr:protein kinase [Candidatus Acidoferrales bacterium]
MPLPAGHRLGPYEIVAPLGAGGMGEVYRARDTRLGRDVAIKVLPAHLSGDPEVRARFEREARTVSSLNHPNICVLYDVGRAPGGTPGGAGSGTDDIDYLVMELIEGDTLAARLQRGALPAAELLRFGIQIADAIDRAHRAGVIHRDLKPGNVMLTRSGVKLMDFGLSRVPGMTGSAGGSGGSAVGLTQSPTVGRALTAEGTLLGTFQYMSPEQLEGREADARSDVWALGCVLYEMATGRRAFEGRSQASLIAAILEREPAPVGEAPSGAPPASGPAPPHGIERLIRNCLAKDPDERVQTAHDVKLQLQGIAEGSGLPATSLAASLPETGRARGARGWNAGLAWSVATAALVGLVATFAWLWPRAHATAASIQFQLNPVPHSAEMYWPRVSPDGRWLVFVAPDSAGTPRTFLRAMNDIEARPIPGTEGVNHAYWSPDSREIAFVADDGLQRVAIAGGSPTMICRSTGGADLSWGSKGMILMDGNLEDSLQVVAAGGGELHPASRIDRAAGELGCGWPCFLPDGEHFLFIGKTSASPGGDIRLGRLGSLDSRKIGSSDGRVEYAPGGWVLFLRGSSLLARKLDLGAAKLTGEPITIVDHLRTGMSEGHFSVSNTGVLALALASGSEVGELRVADRHGARVGSALVRGTIDCPEPSPDGRRLLYRRSDPSRDRGSEAFVYDLARATDTRLTFSNGTVRTPVWSPDGRRFAYVTRTPAADARVVMASADGLGAADSIVLERGTSVSLSQWSAAGSRLMMWSAAFKGLVAPAVGTDRRPRPLLDTAAVEVESQISPNGRWLALVSGTATTNPQVYVETLEGPPGRWQISTANGTFPRWTRDGHELVYESMEGSLMAVDIDTRDGFHAGNPYLLFNLPVGSYSPEASSWGCDASGEHFYVVVPEADPSASRIEITTDFRSLLSRR